MGIFTVVDEFLFDLFASLEDIDLAIFSRSLLLEGGSLSDWCSYVAILAID